MHKSLFFFLMFVTIYSLDAMETSNKLHHKPDVNRIINNNNQTILQLSLLISPDEKQKLQELDCVRSHEIAELYFSGAKINHKDKFNKTALDYAEEIKDQLPNTYKVIRAIKIIAECDSHSQEFKEAQKVLVENYLTMEG